MPCVIPGGGKCPRSLAENPYQGRSETREWMEKPLNCRESSRQERKTIRKAAVRALHLPHLACYQREICHCGGYQRLEQRLGSTEIAGLAGPQLHHARDAVLHHLPKPAVRSIFLAPLKPSGLLQKGFLGMQRDRSPFPWPCRNTAGPQWARTACPRVELEYRSRLTPPSPILVTPSGKQGVRFLPRWAPTRFALQVNGKVLFAEVFSFTAMDAIIQASWSAVRVMRCEIAACRTTTLKRTPPDEGRQGTT